MSGVDSPWANEMKNRISDAIAAAQRAQGCDPDGDPCAGGCRCLALVLREVAGRASQAAAG